MPRRSLRLWAVCTCMTASCAHLDSTETTTASRGHAEGEPGHFRVAGMMAEPDRSERAVIGAAAPPAFAPGVEEATAEPSVRQVAFEIGDGSSGADGFASGEVVPPAPAAEPDGDSGGATSPAGATGYTLNAFEGMALVNKPHAPASVCDGWQGSRFPETGRPLPQPHSWLSRE